MKIKNATAAYTGGGIYIYYGQLEDGNYFRTCDDWESISICSEDTSSEGADYEEFYDNYTIKTLIDDEYKEFWDKMLSWIIDNKPKGNYLINELKSRLITQSAPNPSPICYMCYNARIDEDGELTDDNDYSSCSIGTTSGRHRMMLSSGWGKPLRIEAEEWSEGTGWYNVGIYYPKFCPECGRKITEYDKN